MITWVSVIMLEGQSARSTQPTRQSRAITAGRVRPTMKARTVHIAMVMNHGVEVNSDSSGLMNHDVNHSVNAVVIGYRLCLAQSLSELTTSVNA